MTSTPVIVATVALGLLLVDPAAAQSRRKDDSHRVARREAITGDRNEDRRARQEATRLRADPRRPIRETVGVRPRPDGRGDRDWDRRGLHPRVMIIGPGFERRSHRYGYGYGDGYGLRPGYVAGRVWNRTSGMTCLQLDDELEWAHDEWHYRHDHERGQRLYAVEHARLELAIVEERAWSGCDIPDEERDCRERGRHARTGDALETAILVLDLLLRDR